MAGDHVDHVARRLRDRMPARLRVQACDALAAHCTMHARVVLAVDMAWTSTRSVLSAAIAAMGLPRARAERAVITIAGGFVVGSEQPLSVLRDDELLLISVVPDGTPPGEADAPESAAARKRRKRRLKHAVADAPAADVDAQTGHEPGAAVECTAAAASAKAPRLANESRRPRGRGGVETADAVPTAARSPASEVGAAPPDAPAPRHVAPAAQRPPAPPSAPRHVRFGDDDEEEGDAMAGVDVPAAARPSASAVANGTSGDGGNPNKAPGDCRAVSGATQRGGGTGGTPGLGGGVGRGGGGAKGGEPRARAGEQQTATLHAHTPTQQHAPQPPRLVTPPAPLGGARAGAMGRGALASRLLGSHGPCRSDGGAAEPARTPPPPPPPEPHAAPPQHAAPDYDLLPALNRPPDLGDEIAFRAAVAMVGQPSGAAVPALPTLSAWKCARVVHVRDGRLTLRGRRRALLELQAGSELESDTGPEPDAGGDDEQPPVAAGVHGAAGGRGWAGVDALRGGATAQPRLAPLWPDEEHDVEMLAEVYAHDLYSVRLLRPGEQQQQQTQQQTQQTQQTQAVSHAAASEGAESVPAQPAQCSAAPAPPSPAAPVPSLPAARPRYDKAASIRNQVEYYFSDANLAQDEFMIEQVRAHAGGFVPLAVLRTFRRIERMGLGVDELGAALRGSLALELDEDGSAVRRRSDGEDAAAAVAASAGGMGDGAAAH